MPRPPTPEERAEGAEDPLGYDEADAIFPDDALDLEVTPIPSEEVHEVSSSEEEEEESGSDSEEGGANDRSSQSSASADSRPLTPVESLAVLPNAEANDQMHCLRAIELAASLKSLRVERERQALKKAAIDAKAKELDDARRAAQAEAFRRTDAEFRQREEWEKKRKEAEERAIAERAKAEAEAELLRLQAERIRAEAEAERLRAEEEEREKKNKKRKEEEERRKKRREEEEEKKRKEEEEEKLRVEAVARSELEKAKKTKPPRSPPVSALSKGE